MVFGCFFFRSDSKFVLIEVLNHQSDILLYLPIHRLVWQHAEHIHVAISCFVLLTSDDEKDLEETKVTESRRKTETQRSMTALFCNHAIRTHPLNGNGFQLFISVGIIIRNNRSLRRLRSACELMILGACDLSLSSSAFSGNKIDFLPQFCIRLKGWLRKNFNSVWTNMCSKIMVDW